MGARQWGCGVLMPPIESKYLGECSAQAGAAWRCEADNSIKELQAQLQALHRARTPEDGSGPKELAARLEALEARMPKDGSGQKEAAANVEVLQQAGMLDDDLDAEQLAARLEAMQVRVLSAESASAEELQSLAKAIQGLFRPIQTQVSYRRAEKHVYSGTDWDWLLGSSREGEAASQALIRAESRLACLERWEAHVAGQLQQRAHAMKDAAKAESESGGADEQAREQGVSAEMAQLRGRLEAVEAAAEKLRSRGDDIEEAVEEEQADKNERLEAAEARMRSAVTAGGRGGAGPEGGAPGAARGPGAPCQRLPRGEVPVHGRGGQAAAAGGRARAQRRAAGGC